MKYILIETDGYSINTCEFNSAEDAQAEMKHRYDNRDPQYNNNETDESIINEYDSLLDLYNQSYFEENNAILYTGDDVYVWKIISVK